MTHRDVQPGRRFSRAYQHRETPTRFLCMEEWQSRADYERYQRSASSAMRVTNSHSSIVESWKVM